MENVPLGVEVWIGVYALILVAHDSREYSRWCELVWHLVILCTMDYRSEIVYPSLLYFLVLLSTQALRNTFSA